MSRTDERRKMKLPSIKYKDYQDIIMAVGTALDIDDSEVIKDLCRYGMKKKYLIKNSKINMYNANTFIREKLPIKRAYRFAKHELLNLKEFIKIYNSPAILRVNKSYIYFDGEDYFSKYNLDNEKVTEAWRLWEKTNVNK